MVERDSVWKPLADALELQRDTGRRARFWLRDDDAVEPTPAMDRLLATCEAAHVSVALAVIPQPTGPTLADRLRQAKGVTVAVHGWAHTNHAGASEKKQELGAQRPAGIVLDELREGLAKLTALHGENTLPMLVPPWNRIDPALMPGLAGIGFTALSVFGPPKPAPIPVINTNVDLIDWHGTRGCVDHAVLVRNIVAQLERPEPVGLLAHHLVHDEAAWTFLEELFACTRRFDAEWLSAGELLTGRE